MSSERELEKQLKQEADGVIKQILANKKPAGQNSLKDLERIAVRAGQGFEERVMQYLAQAESEAAPEPVCEECGRRMRSRGKRRRDVVTQAGEVRVARGYYVCPRCGKKAFPPG